MAAGATEVRTAAATAAGTPLATVTATVEEVPREGAAKAREAGATGAAVTVASRGRRRLWERRRSSTFSLRCLVECWRVLDTVCMDIRVFFDQ